MQFTFVGRKRAYICPESSDKTDEKGKRYLVAIERLTTCMEEAVEISKERMRLAVAQDVVLSQERKFNSQERQINHIKALLEESGDFMDAQEKKKWRRKLYELRKCIASGADGGNGF